MGRKLSEGVWWVKIIVSFVPILAYPTANGKFILDTDTSETGLGGVLNFIINGKGISLHKEIK